MVEFDTPQKLEDYVTPLIHENGLDTMATIKRIDISPDCGISYSIFPNKSLDKIVNFDKLSAHDLTNLKSYLNYLDESFIPNIVESLKGTNLNMVYVGKDLGEFSEIVRYDPFNTLEKNLSEKPSFQRAPQLISRVGIGSFTRTTPEQVSTLFDILTGRYAKLDFASLKLVRRYYESGVDSHECT